MLLGETWVGHGNTHREEVDGGLPFRTVDEMLPSLLSPCAREEGILWIPGQRMSEATPKGGGSPMWMVDDEEPTVRGIKSGSVPSPFGNNPIMPLQPPHHSLVATLRAALGTREKDLGVEPIDERRMQVELRLGMQKMLQAVHGAKVRKLSDMAKFFLTYPK